VRSPNAVVSVGVYALAHGVAEFLVGFRLFYSMRPDSAANPLLLYTACAFLLPVPIALVSDRLRRPALLGAAGLAVLAGALALPGGTGAAAVMGIGNAGLHVTGAGAALRTRMPASAVGLFVAPGAIGLACGITLGQSSAPWPWYLILIGLGTACLVGAFGGDARPEAHGIGLRRSERLPLAAVGVASLIVFALARTLAGSAAPTGWKTGTGLALAVAGAAAVGKALGGPLGDRFNPLAVMATSAAGAAIAVPLFAAWAPGALAGLVLINLSVAPLLACLAKLMPGREGLVFGIGQACQFPVALLGGLVWPTWAPGAILAAMALLAGLLAVALGQASRGDEPLHHLAGPHLVTEEG
jgi:FSR family fosmidomycin resistance protein-like MFS transporter